MNWKGLAAGGGESGSWAKAIAQTEEQSRILASMPDLSAGLSFIEFFKHTPRVPISLLDEVASAAEASYAVRRLN